MSEKTRLIRVEFGPFRIVLEGYANSSEGVDMAVQLIRNLSAFDLAPGTAEFSPPTHDAPRRQAEQPRQKPEKPLLLQEEARSAKAAAPEFHSIRLDAAAEPAGLDDQPRWLADIERLEASARLAMDTLTSGPETPERVEAAPNSKPLPAATTTPEQPTADARTNELPSGPEDSRIQDDAQHPAPAEPVDPGPEADGFSPRAVANADIRPEDGEPGPENDREIRENMDINRRAIVQAAADSSKAHGSQNAISHDYLAMEDKAIDRLLETTNALLENDDHTRKNQSLDRLKAAVVATEAERRISVKTATGTVTLDFEEKGSTRRPVADLLAAPKIDPEKRRQRLQDYRKMISEHKKRP